jgi:hypothetical protein
VKTLEANGLARSKADLISRDGPGKIKGETMTLRERALEACQADQDLLLQFQMQEQIKARDKTIRLIEKLLGVAAVDMIDQHDGTILVDGLIFRTYYSEYEDKLEVGIPCLNCGKPVWRRVVNLISLGRFINKDYIEIHNCIQKKSEVDPIREAIRQLIQEEELRYHV